MNNKSRIKTLPGFHAGKLNNDRDIYVYLPPGYEENTEKHYPVLYMQDGQNIFDSVGITGYSWNIHAVADQLISEGKMEEIIIVGIPNMGIERNNEYFIYAPPFKKLPGAARYKDLIYKGMLYEDFLLHDLKPHIDTFYRTLKDSENTALMGSSMGGLITYNIGRRNPDVFGKLGIISPYFTYFDTETKEETDFFKNLDNTENIKMWIDIGEAEGLIMERHARKVADTHIAKGCIYGKELIYYCAPGAGHNERYWGERIHAPLLYLFGNIGKPVSAEIHGRNIVGIKGLQGRINPLIKYDSGFVMTDLNGEYRIQDPRILEVKRDGTIFPKSVGTTKVTYKLGKIEVSKVYTVIDELPETVDMTIRIKRPVDADCDLSMNIYHYANCIELKEQKKGLYECRCSVPRDVEFSEGLFNIQMESERYTKTVINKRFKVDKEMVINYEL